MAGKTRLEGKNIDIALKILKDTTDVLDRLKISYWLEGGTLLGIIRENRLLPWDNDMDISMYKKEQSKLFRAVILLTLKGYRISVKRYKKSIGPFKKYELRMIKVRNYEFPLKKGEIMLDIFIKLKMDDDYYWTVGVKNPVLKSSPAKYYESLSRYPFDSKEYSIPSDYKGYLTYRYGDWKKQVKTWNFKKDDQAIVHSGSKG